MCSVPALDGPVISKAIARDGLIAEWRVYADNEETRRLLALVFEPEDLLARCGHSTQRT